MEIPYYNRLKGQTAIITGASSGIGKAIALQMAKEGAKVVINYHGGSERAKEVVDQILDSGGQAIPFKADISKEDQVMALFGKTLQTFGTLHILVNNAGIEDKAYVENMSLDQWQKVISVNLTGTFLCSREAVKEFKKRGVDSSVSLSAGKIICISSVHERIPWTNNANYAASKGGMMLFMESLAQEVAKDKIRVNNIGPGAIKTPINKHSWDTPEKEEKLLKLIPYKRMGDPEDIARAAVWLASDESDYVTGTTLYIDGGMTLYPAFAHER